MTEIKQWHRDLANRMMAWFKENFEDSGEGAVGFADIPEDVDDIAQLIADHAPASTYPKGVVEKPLAWRVEAETDIGVPDRHNFYLRTYVTIETANAEKETVERNGGRATIVPLYAHPASEITVDAEKDVDLDKLTTALCRSLGVSEESFRDNLIVVGITHRELVAAISAAGGGK